MLEVGAAFFLQSANSRFNVCGTKVRKVHVAETALSTTEISQSGKTEKGVCPKCVNDGPMMSDDKNDIPRLHIISRFIFPSTFFIFLVVYWSYYLSKE